jgi:hypothetical protein
MREKESIESGTFNHAGLVILAANILTLQWHSLTLLLLRDIEAVKAD